METFLSVLVGLLFVAGFAYLVLSKKCPAWFPQNLCRKRKTDVQP